MAFLFSDPLILLLIAIIVLSILYYYRSIILPSRKSIPREILSEERKRFTRVPEITECPRCGRTMEEGYLVGPGGIYWSKTAPLHDIIGAGRWRYGFGIPGMEPLGPSALRGAGIVAHLKVYRCLSCDMVYIDLTRQGLSG